MTPTPTPPMTEERLGELRRVAAFPTGYEMLELCAEVSRLQSEVAHWKAARDAAQAKGELLLNELSEAKAETAALRGALKDIVRACEDRSIGVATSRARAALASLSPEPSNA